MHEDADRPFGSFLKGIEMAGSPSIVTLLESSSKSNAMVQEHKKHVSIAIGLVGIAESDIEVFVSGHVVTVSGEREKQTTTKVGNNFLTDRFCATFSTSVSLPFVVDADKVEARFSNGYLEVIVKKPEAGMPMATKVPIGI